MRRPEVCVVTPIKNGERYLAEAIESVLGQTLANWEYVIMDGGSHDNSLSIAREYERKDDRITVVSSPDKGMYDAVFKGFQRTTAPVCCWLPSDDKFMPWAFEIAAKYMARMGAEWVTGIPARWDKEGLLHHVSFPQCYLRPLIRLGLYDGRCLNYIQQASTFFSRDLLSKMGPDDVEMIKNLKGAGDFLLWTRFARYSPLQTVPTVLSGFRQHGGNWSSKYADLYRTEISNLGFHVPSSQAVGKLMRLLLWPLALWKVKRVYRDWHRLLNSEVN
jgi:glycosyltransferase involved in cell wall biosynthesis